MKAKRMLLLVLAGAALFAVGRCTAGGGADAPGGAPATAAAPETATVWTCPMHPQIRLPDPGDCPICGMDLVPQDSLAEGDDAPARLVMSPAARELAGVRTAPVVRANVTRPVRMVGKVDFDETAVRTISAWVPGRLDRLYVDYTGVRVQKGDHLVRLYSPELLTAQEELLSARGRPETTAGEASQFLARSNRRAYATAREKLLLWGLTEEQVDEVEERGTAENHVMLTSPRSGVVIDKLIDEGAYVQTGTHIYRIADLAQLWVRLDAYEQDLAWLRHGQDVTFAVEALPGETFHGRISYIDPVVHERTRTAKVRLNVDNEGGRLKPGMFVRAVASSRLGAGGAVLDRALAGKWVSPMHPEIVKDHPGQCDVCGMDLVPAEELGLVDSMEPTGLRPLVVPASAVLVTGRRAVAYVEVPDAERPTYEGREVVLGPRAGDQYLVLSGLEEGERVVVHGAFRIDSSMQIRAQPSMMSQRSESTRPPGPEVLAFLESLRPLDRAYLGAQEALAADDAAGAAAAFGALADALAERADADVPAAARPAWEELRDALRGAVEAVGELDGESGDLAGLRRAFADASAARIELASELGHAGDPPLRQVFCPMALDGHGASWLQVGDAVRNPFFGASMLRCGELRGTFGADREPDPDPQSEHEPDPEPDHGMDREVQDDAGGHAGHDHAAPDAAPGADADGVDGAALDAVFAAYLAAQRHLAADEPEEARRSLGELRDAAAAAAQAAAVPAALAPLRALARTPAEPADPAALREAFRDATGALLELERAAGNPTPDELRVVHCPMAFDGAGADWLQTGEDVANPYFGAAMLRCGELVRVSAPR